MQPNRTIRFFWKLIGEDEQIVNLCSKRTQGYFLLGGVIFFFFFVLSLFSFHYVFNSIFEIPILSWPLAIIWSLIIFNIYRLNLSTLSANKPKYSFGYFMSLVIRLLFMLLISITLIKPLEIQVFEKFLIPELNTYRSQKISSNEAKITSYFNNQINEVNEEFKVLELQIKEERITLDNNQLVSLENKRYALIQEKKKVLLETRNLFKASNFFFNGILIFNKKYPLVWLLTLLLLILFLLPLFLKFAIAPNSVYAKHRNQLQHTMILEDYTSFKLKYPSVFKGFLSDSISWDEKYEDPPFNTKRLEIKEKYGDEKDFINQIYGV